MNKVAENVIFELWMTFSEKLLARIIEVTELTYEQAEALKAVMLRPNDYIVEISQ
jgi:hypothetical protein